MPKAPRPLRDGSLAAALGVTRIARLTGLDRTGVEVASAVRPGAHVLQVTNGKGETFEPAARGALLEAAELWAAERAQVDAWGCASDLAAAHGEDAVVRPEALAPERAEPGWAGLRLAWRAGQELLGGAPALVPACAVHCPPAGGPLLGAAVVPWTSNGMGAHEDRAAALLHALLEAIERDLLARALPEGFTEEAVAARPPPPRSRPRAAPRAAELAARLEARGFGVHLLDASAPASAPARGAAGAVPALPCAAALIADHEHGAVPLSAGYACRLDRDDALLAALLEAAQSRATEIHGAREDVAVGDRRAATGLAALLGGTRARREAGRMQGVRDAGDAAEAVRAVLALLRRARIARVVAVELDAPPGVHVVKVVVPGLALSELL
ncbi:YcaO-like family protein [Anaeromyxobacter terrae]|uniref:YcaO-like family protein n=1 Tax=Anaeromyxobacter terrae TaxID=2925406 RepID=UPI001F5AE2F9|nr:YcaO-like family protein [Anaeromyxobacter sp. SG22]